MNSMQNRDSSIGYSIRAEGKGRYLSLLVGAATLFGLYLTSLYSYTLFHTLAELFSIVIAFSIFVIAWNSRPFLANNYLLLIGIAYLFVGATDLTHALAYKGMGVFKIHDADHPTQLWIAARYMESISLLIAPFFVGRTLNHRAVFGMYAAVFFALLWSIFGSNIFPVCYIDGVGLTPFKKNSEYVISILLLLSGVALLRKKKSFDRRVLLLISLSICATVFSELFFTFYISVYDLSNLVGHMLKIISFYLIYLAIIKTGIRDPFEIIFRDLKQREAELEASKEGLELRVAGRTLELSRSNELLRQEIDERRQAEEALRRLNRELRAISSCNQVLMRATDEQTLLNDICRIICDEAGYRMAWVGYAENDGARTIRSVARAGVEDGYLAEAKVTWADTERGRDPAGTAVRSGEPVCMQDFATDPKAGLWRDSALQRGYRSCIGLPLKDERALTFGVLVIYSTEPGAFTADEMRLLGELAGDLAFGITVLRGRIRQKRTDEDLRGEADRRKVLLELYEKATLLTEKQLYDYALDQAVRLTDSTIGFFHLVSDDQKSVILTTWNREALKNCSASYATHYSIDEAGNWVDCIRLRRPVIYNDFQASPNQKGLPEGHSPVLRFMSIPVMEGDKVRIIFGVGNKVEEYDERDAVHIQLVAHELQEIIRQRRAEEEIKEEAEVSRSLLEIVETLNTSLDERELIRNVVSLAPHYLRFAKAAIYLYDDEIKSLIFAGGYGFSPVEEGMLVSRTLKKGDFPAVERILNGETIIIENAEETDLISREVVETFNIGSGIIVPICFRQKLIGAVQGEYESAGAVAKKDVSLLKGLANGLAIAIQNSRLYRESVERLMELSSRMETIKTMAQLDREILSNIDRNTILNAATAMLNRVIPCDRTAIILKAGDRYKVVSEWGVGRFRNLVYEKKEIDAAIVEEKRSSVFIPDISANRAGCLYHKAMIETGLKSSLIVPLIGKEGMVGFLDISSLHYGRLSAADLGTAENVAAQITVALENARLYEELEQLLINTITSLASAIDAKSPWTKGHSERVTRYAVEIAREMGLKDQEVEQLRLSGLLHDVGKIGTYDIVLDKPGKLTEEEFEIVKKHPGKGAEILAPIRQLADIIPAILHHHEAYDGRGYPNGLKGEAIPLHARILCVADAYDSMTADRPYRQSPGREYAVSEFERCSGTQFDPTVVRVFLKVLKRQTE